MNAVLNRVTEGLDLPRALEQDLPAGVTAAARDGFIFLQNYSGAEQQLILPRKMKDLISGGEIGPKVILPVNGVMILE